LLCRPDDKGFTLIEILVAVLLFLIGAVAVARVQTTSIRGGTFGKEALIATTAAQTVTEQLKEQPVLGNFATILAGGGPSPVFSGMNIATIQAGTGVSTVPGMTIQWRAAGTTGTVGTRYTTVTVTVQWPNTRSYATSTIISEN
jgi:prepilin-type N-terminal cleavage/methylation domain-containing protein